MVVCAVCALRCGVYANGARTRSARLHDARNHLKRQEVGHGCICAAGGSRAVLGSSTIGCAATAAGVCHRAHQVCTSVPSPRRCAKALAAGWSVRGATLREATERQGCHTHRWGSGCQRCIRRYMHTWRHMSGTAGSGPHLRCNAGTEAREHERVEASGGAPSNNRRLSKAAWPAQQPFETRAAAPCRLWRRRALAMARVRACRLAGKLNASGVSSSHPPPMGAPNADAGNTQSVDLHVMPCAGVHTARCSARDRSAVVSFGAATRSCRRGAVNGSAMP